MNKCITGFILAAISAFATAAEPDEKALLYPTGLTVVVTDPAGKVLDTVKVPDDGKFYEITFRIGDEEPGIRVFTLGTRVSGDLPKNIYFKGMSKKPGGGLGRVVVSIDEGKVTGVSGSGFGTLALTEDIRKAIASDLKEDKPAALTTMDELVDEEEAE